LQTIYCEICFVANWLGAKSCYYDHHFGNIEKQKTKKKNFFGMWNKILRGKVERTMGKCVVNGGQHKKVGNDRKGEGKERWEGREICHS
jgi:hypothetical protein